MLRQRQHEAGTGTSSVHSRKSERLSSDLFNANLHRVSVPRHIRVLVVDDDPDFVDILYTVLTAQRIFQVLPCTSSRLAVDLLAHFEPDLALIDIKLPEIDGFECADIIQERRPETIIMLISGDISGTPKQQFRKTHAYSFLQKSLRPGEMLNAIFSALGGFAHIHPKDVPANDRHSKRGIFISEKRLTPREVLTLDLLTLEGLQNKEIAARLNCSLAAAEKVLRKIYKKLNIHRRIAAVAVWRDYLNH